MSEKRKRKNEDVAKEKRGEISRKRQIFFVGAWIASTLLPLAGAVWFFNSGGETGGAEAIRWLVMSVLLSGSVAALQTFSLKRILRYPAKGWFAATFLGWLITANIPLFGWLLERIVPGYYNSFYFVFFGIDLMFIMIATYWIIAPTFLQWLTLRNRVRSARRWITANLLSVSLLSVFVMWFFNVMFSSLSEGMVSLALVGVVIMGVIMWFAIPGFFLSEMIQHRAEKSEDEAELLDDLDVEPAAFSAEVLDDFEQAYDPGETKLGDLLRRNS